MEIRFDYEYDCGGHVYTKYATIDKEEFEKDKLLIAVCSYLQTECCYPGKTIDEYLHNRFSETHTLEDMYGHCGYNVYNCDVDGLRDFYQISDGMLGLSNSEAVSWVLKECEEFNKNCKGKEKENFSIWED